MPTRASVIPAILLLLTALPALAQSEPPGAAAVTLAAGRLDSVVDMPLFVRLYRARLPPTRQVTYEGSSTMLYGLSGEASIAIGKGDAKSFVEGGGMFIPAGQIATIRAAGPEPVDLLLFLLTARPNQRSLLSRPAVVHEVFRTGEPLPGLQPGPYRFTLTRVTLMAGAVSGSAYSHAGAALDYVLSGSAMLTAAGESETAEAGMPLFERVGRVHRLVNPGPVPLILVQADISQEGVPSVQPVGEK